MAMQRCKHGTFLFNIHDLVIGRSLDLYGQWCEEELSLLGQIVKPGDVVLDVGANIGTHTVFFAKAVGDQGLVVAFEPQRLAFQNLCANLALNSLTNGLARQQALGRRAETVRMPLLNPRFDQNFGGFAVHDHGVGLPVEVMRLDDMPLPRCDLLKVDVEGMECDVLEGARESIARHRPVLFVENDTLERSASVIAMIESLEYDMYWHIIRYFDAQNYFGNPHDVFTEYSPAANLICVHRSRRSDIVGLRKVAGPHDNWQLALERGV
jgi:FkbM family methyltransferase